MTSQPDAGTSRHNTTACRTSRHRLCGGHGCACACHPGTPETRKAEADDAVKDWLTELGEVTGSTGRHGGHTLKQVGRCVYCSCGYRYQGTMPGHAAGRDAGGEQDA